MKKTTALFVVIFFISGCSPHFHLDFLGTENMVEVILQDSPAKEKILMIDISGIISSTLNIGFLEREGDVVSRIYYRLQKAAEDKYVKGVILRLDTPGGEVTASDILYNEILKFKKKKNIPVISLAMGVAASGGYYIAAASDYIIAHPSTITGSIGVISVFPNVAKLISFFGVEMNVIKSGEMKDAGSSFREMSEKDRQLYQDIIDEFYEGFLDAVMSSRKEHLSREDLRKLADGRVYTAKQALALNLIDEVGYMDTAIKKVQDMAGLRDTRIVTYTYYPKTKTNIYASSQPKPEMFNKDSLERILPTLKSGFYYLWLPYLNDS